MNDEQYNNLIKRELEENEEVFFSDIKHNKNRIWNLIEHRLEKKRIIPLWFYYAAASIVLLFGISFLFSYEMKLKSIEIAQLNKKLVKLENQKNKDRINIISKTDTIKLIKNKFVYVPVIKQNTIIEHDTIVRLITQIDTVFINETIPGLIVENEISKSDIAVFNNDITPSNKVKTKKKRRFVFRFGMLGNNIVGKVQKESLLSLKTELK